MKETIEQIMWSIRTYIAREYDDNILLSFKNRKNAIRYLIFYGLCPILISYIIVVGRDNSSNNDGDISEINNNNNNGDDAKRSLFTILFTNIYNITILSLATLLLNLWHAILRVVGITLGLGLGLGLAGHVYDVLSDASVDNGGNIAATATNNSSNTSSSNIQNNNNSKPNFPKESILSTTNILMEDTNSYSSLMRNAGYNIDTGMLRAQMVRGDQATLVTEANYSKRCSLLSEYDSNRQLLQKEGSNEGDEQRQQQQQQQQSQQRQLQHPKMSLYKFTKGTKATTQMKHMWPNLSPIINESLSKLTEYVLRDYVSCWYGKVDEGVVYVDPEEEEVRDREEGMEGDGYEKVENETLTTTTGEGGDNHRRPSTAPSDVSTVASSTVTTTTSASTKTGLLSRSASEYTPAVAAATARRPSTSHSEIRTTSLLNNSISSTSVTSTVLQSPYAIISPNNSISDDQNQQQQQQQQQRTMVLTTTGTQSSPFIDSLYTSFAYLLGMMATRSSENVNILELLLLHFPHILAQNLRVYREMKMMALEKKRRRIVVEREKWRKGQMEAVREGGGSSSGGIGGLMGESTRQFTASAIGMTNMPTNSERELESNDVSEIAIVREYLLAGRLHSALTFGMDVPSLLFADPLGKDCPPGPSYQRNSDRERQMGHTDEDAILENRLLSPESSLIAECELDYNRVLASKIAKLVVPKNEIESSVVRTMLVEMLAGCVLCPSMGCFTPDYVNGWLITGLKLLEDGGETEGVTDDAASTTAAPPASTTSAAAVRNEEKTLDVVTTGHQSIVSEFDMRTNDSLSGVPHANSAESSTGRLDAIVDGVMEEIITSGGSVRSDMEDTLFEEEYVDNNTCNEAEQIITLLSMSIIELGRFIDFEDCRHARARNEDILVDWDQSHCRRAVKHLVLVIEAALLLGVRSERKRTSESVEETDDSSVMDQTMAMEYDDEFEVEIHENTPAAGSTGHHHASLSAALMELTGDIDAFEKLILDSEQDDSADDASFDDGTQISFNIPKPNELSTLRTLIAAWLHTGQVFKVLSIISHAKKSILIPFYHGSAFLRRDNYSSDFIRLLRQLDGVEILVDTHSVLTSQCILVGNGFDTLMQDFQKDFNQNQKKEDPFAEMRGRSIAKEPLFSQGIFGQQSMVGSMRAKSAQNFSRIARFAQSASESFHSPLDESSSSTSNRPFSANIAFQAQNNNHSTPAYLDFSKNSTFASSLRSERERRLESWAKEISNMEKIEFFCRPRAIKDKDAMLHRELHHLSRYFYSYTSEMRIEPCSISDDESDSPPTLSANLTVKGVSSRRRLEVPDEDSSFLLRVQPKPLKPASVHRDQRNPSLACKIYFAMYEEPAIHPKTKRFYGGRYLRQCLLKYYPSDRTASVSVSKNISVLDGRTRERSGSFVLTEEFQKLRHACLKVAVGGILSSPLMEPSDFAATPRTGKALDFVYRSSLFGPPVVDLGGKKFIVHDAASHRADASALELSDASMSAAIITRGARGLNMLDSPTSATDFKVEVGSEGTPIVLLRANKSNNSGGSPNNEEETRPYRPSFIRAALYVKGAKQEAQQLCLNYCIRGGSARSSAKMKPDEWLQPTLILLQYANSRRQEDQSTLLRDLRLGINHIDRGQLSRNGLLNPRYPTILRGLNTRIIGTVEAKAPSDFDLLSPSIILYKIRCTAIAEYIGEDDEDDEHGTGSVDMPGERKASKPKTRYFREEWTVLRSLRDFSVFHKHIKGQVAQTESSGTTGTKLAGVASSMVGGVTSALGGGNTINGQRQRGPLVPSLSHATKAGALPGLSTKKVTEKRKKLLDEYLQYLVSPNNLLSQCPELLKFLGAYTPIFPAGGNAQLDDSYGREDIKRVELVTEKLKVGIVEAKHSVKKDKATDIASKHVSSEAVTPPKVETVDEKPTPKLEGTPATTTTEEQSKSVENKYSSAAKRIATIRAGEIRLKEVRRSIFRLLRYMFDLDNASFFRSRVISVLKTMSVAVTSAQDFQTMMFQMHMTYMNGEWISGWIYYLVDMFWPDGVFYTKGPDLTEEEQLHLKHNSKEILEKMFPDQLKTVLGKHTEEGLDMLHEMLQNRVVLKSMAYMIMDLVWAEIFPELGDFVTGAESLEKE